jgi:hypothetical protein
MGGQQSRSLPYSEKYVNEKTVIGGKIGDRPFHAQLIKVQDSAVPDCVQQNISIIDRVGNVCIRENNCSKKQDRGKNDHLSDTKEILPRPAYTCLLGIQFC